MTVTNDDQGVDDWYLEKTERMQSLLGPEHDRVMHALIPYSAGGHLDLYYFVHPELGGTAVGTKELCLSPGDGPSNVYVGCYELAMFTRQPLSLKDVHDLSTPFGQMHDTINSFLNCVARYSDEATLNAGETCEFPAEMEFLGGRCLIFDVWADETNNDFGLLVVIEIHRDEMEYARENGGEAVLELLQQAGHYPFSDLERDSVVGREIPTGGL
jgi:Suppressor of fused protein (SUFU)